MPRPLGPRQRAVHSPEDEDGGSNACVRLESLYGNSGSGELGQGEEEGAVGISIE